VPDYANDQRHAYAIDGQMRKLGRLERYNKELAKITKAKNLPPEWATPEQRSRAALSLKYPTITASNYQVYSHR